MRQQRDLRIDVIPRYVSADEMADIIIQALWGSAQTAAREFLAKEKGGVENECSR